MWLVLLACRDDARHTDGADPRLPVGLPAPTRDPAGPLAFTVEPAILLPETNKVRLVQRLVATTDRAARATVVLDDGVARREIAWPEAGTEHDLPLLGLHAETAYTLTATFTDLDGGTLTAELSFET